MYAITEPHLSGYLTVSDVHQIYYEVSGNPHGKPVVFLHGGPGGDTAPKHRGFFNPEKYRIILFDQRGCGKSLPYACIEQNTTWDLVEDIEQLRKHLNVEQWVVFGGSWGSTLALSYAQSYPERVKALVLRGIFLCRQQEIDWICKKGANDIYPDYWADFIAPVAAHERHDLVAAYRQLLHPDNPNQTQMYQAATAWAKWECHIVLLEHNAHLGDEYDDGHTALAISRIENHYFAHLGWLEHERAILHPQNIAKIRHIPTVIVQGRYDICTPPTSAWDLKMAFPEAELIWTLAGHAAAEPETAKYLVAATDRFANL
ncbi:MAG: prolyl aminopeptidase [Acinetobacter sp.]|nr:prolyl aminopeptidase [Acinetobacter sp.]